MQIDEGHTRMKGIAGRKGRRTASAERGSRCRQSRRHGFLQTGHVNFSPLHPPYIGPHRHLVNNPPHNR
jgi:hypothetical protein